MVPLLDQPRTPEYFFFYRDSQKENLCKRVCESVFLSVLFSRTFIYYSMGEGCLSNPTSSFFFLVLKRVKMKKGIELLNLRRVNLLSPSRQNQGDHVLPIQAHKTSR